MSKRLAGPKHKKSNNIRLLLLTLVMLAVLTTLYIIANLNPAEVTVWAPGPSFGYETPNNKV